MKNELIQLNELIVASLQLPIEQQQQLGQNRLNQIESELSAARFMLINALEILACGKQRHHILTRHVNKVQDYCCRTLAKISAQQNDSAKRTEVLSLVKISLLDLLNQVKSTFMLCFDHSKAVPVHWRLQKMAQLKENEVLLLASFKKINLKAGLKEILIHKLTSEIPCHTYSFEQLDYLVICQTSLLNFCKQIANEQIEVLLIQHLIYFNFNEIDFLIYVKQLMAIELELLLNDKAQYQRLCEMEQELVCIATQQQFGFLKDNATAKSQLLAHVTAGIVYFHRKADFNGATPPTVKQMLVLEKYRLKINLSSSGLAYLVRLLIDTGVIDAGPRSKVLQFFAENFQTPGIGDDMISLYSLQMKYKQVVQKTANNLRTVLRKMINEIDTNFN